METPERFSGNNKPEGSDEEERLKQLDAAAEAARIAGVYIPEAEGEK